LADIELKYPSNIWFLILAVVAVVFFVLAFGKKEKIIAALSLGYKTRFRALRAVLIGAGLVSMVFALLGPQVFSGYAEVSKTGIDIYLIMDTSKSMLVTDIAPDRMTIAKKIAGDLLDSLDGDRIGFIPFASDAYIQMPLTDDYQLARMFLDVMDTEMIGGGGTNLAAAIKLANDSFERSSGADRVILIFSDGEENEKASLDVLKTITDEQVKIYTVGVGTANGGLVPVYGETGDTIIDYMKDESGNPVTSRLNAQTLKQLADRGHGAYYQATLQGSETLSLRGDLSALKKDDYKMEQIKRYSPLYQYFLGPGLLLFMIAWFIPERKVAV
jgi:Ca-activated chloride channel family protein